MKLPSVCGLCVRDGLLVRVDVTTQNVVRFWLKQYCCCQLTCLMCLCCLFEVLVAEVLAVLMLVKEMLEVLVVVVLGEVLVASTC